LDGQGRPKRGMGGQGKRKSLVGGGWCVGASVRKKKKGYLLGGILWNQNCGGGRRLELPMRKVKMGGDLVDRNRKKYLWGLGCFFISVGE